MTTRPLHEPYRQILDRLVERGPLPKYDLTIEGCNLRHTLGCMVELGYVITERVAAARPRLYHATVHGRRVLAAGVVECERRGPKIHKAFNAAEFPKPQVTPTGCVHLWDIETTLSQSGTCRKCGAVKVFRPIFSADLVLVGGRL